MFKENYEITLEEAKQIEGYEFTKNIEVVELKKQIESNTFDMFNKNGGNVPFVLEFKNIDIELTILDNEKSYCGYDLGYFICIKNDTGWESFDYSDTKVDLTVENVEEFMFNDLIKFAKRYNLYWSKLND
ncbi:MAG TPA: hypothetical protein VIK86_02025 [Candidatus Paceibacterota bacterium]